MDSIVSIDIETTGLDPERDAIIEIGAVRFKGARVEGEWSTLIHPGKPIPPMITQLTGINDQMVLRAPSIKQVVGELAAFVGDLPVVGHSVKFDLSFLRRNRILAFNEVLDTYEAASVALPRAERYNLGALAQSLGVLLPATHRALDDAHATRGVWLALYEIFYNLPLNLLAELARLSEPLEWGAQGLIQRVLRARGKELISNKDVEPPETARLFTPPKGSVFAPVQQVTEAASLNVEDVAAILEYGGIFHQTLPGFEYRPQQVEMLRAVARSLSDGSHLMVEAGTGTGKSMAYLIPAALFALQNNTRVVISTNTINLQDQLVNKDIPDICATLDIPLRATVMKGRANYLCPRRLDYLRRRGPQTADEMRVLGKILTWLLESQSGDRAEINLNGPVEREIWSRLSADDDGCKTENCIKLGGICPFHRARQTAESAHLVIVNHALLLTDMATGNRVLPNYSYLVVDEAHHIEAATTNALSFKATQTDIERLLRELGGPRSGLLGLILTVLSEALNPADYAAFEHLAQQSANLAFRLESLARSFYQTLDQFLLEQRDGKPIGNYSHQERILPATRTQPSWSAVELAWEEAQHTLAPLIDTLAAIIKGLASASKALSLENQELSNLASNIYRRFLDLNTNLNALVFEPDENIIYWVEIQPDGHRLTLNAAPLHIGALMERYLWNEKASVILTSATLTTAGEFDYLRGRLNAETVDELALGSPFDYESAALLYLVNDIPEPNDRQGHQRAIESGLIQLCQATGGRALILFTSYEQLRRTSAAISPALARHSITVYEQGDGASAHSLLETFKTSERAVLLGTRSFWEGVDVPGEALSVLVIIKLPFDVPSDPIVAARAETFEDPFNQYALPEAILRFRQGFGRLIRTQSDRGVVIVLDRRLLSKQYGRLFLDSLPTCTVKTGSLANAPRAAAQWLNI